MTLSGFEFTAKIHESPQALVQRGIRQRDQRAVVVKSVSVRDDTAVYRCRHQYELTSTLSMRGVIRTLDLLQTTTHLHLVMEDAGSRNLRDVITAGQISIADVLLYAEGLASSLETLHAHHIIHRDLNPTNIIVGDDLPSISIADLGLAVRLSPSAPYLVTETMEGTLSYMAPEQTGRVRRPIDVRSDLYALGCVIYDMVAGVPPFSSDDTLELIHAQIARTPLPLHERRSDCPRSLSDLVSILLQKDPEQRYQSAYGVRHDLSQIQRSLSTGVVVTLKANDRSERFVISQKLHGRTRELQTMRTALGQTRSGNLQAVIVRGMAGSGKTTILRTFEREARAEGSLVISGKQDQFAQGLPMSSVIQAVSAFVRLVLREPQDVVDVWRDRLGSSIGNNMSVVVKAVPDMRFLIRDEQDAISSTAQEMQVRLYTALAAMLSCIADQGRDLIVLLDDLQWADQATFELLAMLGNKIPDARILIVATIRAEEKLAADHPLSLWTQQIAPPPLPIQIVDVHPLGTEAMSELVCETFQLEHAQAVPLVEAMHQRTGGNPLFNVQLMNYMVNEGIVLYDRGRRQWMWDIERLRKMPMQFDVQDLIASRFEQLDTASMRLIAVAACIGTSFSVDRVSNVAGIPLAEVVASVDKAMAAGLITWGDATMTNVFEFVHDRIQQIAHQSLSDEDRQQVHASIARSYLNGERDVEEEDLLTVASHIESALGALTDPKERDQACLLLYRAGHRARSGGVLRTARLHIDMGRSLEHESLWNSHHDALLQASLELADCVGAVGEYHLADSIIAELLPRARTPLERAKIKYLHISILVVQARFDETLSGGIEALAELGIKVKPDPSKLDIVTMLAKTWRAVRGRTPAVLGQRPFNNDERLKLASEILFLLTSPGFNFSIDLLSSIVLVRTYLVMHHGHSDVSIDAYAMFGLVLGGMSLPKRAATFAQLSIDLVQRTMDAGARIRAHNISAGNVLLWTRPIADCIAEFQRGAEISVQTGEQHGTLWSLGVQSEQRLFAGYPLLEIAEYNAEAVQLLHRVYQRTTGLPWTARYFEAAVQKVITAVAPDLPRVDDLTELIDDEQTLLQNMRDSKDATAMCSWLVTDLQIATLLWETDKALRVSAQFDPWKHALSGQSLQVDREFYAALAHAQHLLKNEKPLSKVHQRQLARGVGLFKKWRKHNAENFESRLNILLGAQHLVMGRAEAALELFSAAVSHANDLGDLLMSALAAEWCVHAIDRTAMRDASKFYRQRASAAWRAWGSPILADRLTLPEAGSQREARYDRPTVTQTTLAGSVGLRQETIDIDTVLKASSAISGTIVFEDLIQDMMRIVMENAGADRSVLVLQDGTHFHVVASTTLQGTTMLKEKERAENTNLLCRPLVLQALRIGNTIVIDDASIDDELSTDSYIVANGPRSVMALPIAHQGRLIGLLYFENTNTTHAFTPSRTRVLQLLSSQIAVSIENARLYDVQEKLRAASARFVPTEFLESLGRDSIRDVILGDAVRTTMTVLFADIRGFTSIAERSTAEDVFKLLNRYLAGVVPVIRNNHGFIDKFIGDAVMGLFPREPADAVRAAIDIAHAVKAVNTELEGEGMPPLAIGIGIHTGDIVLGTVGSDRRMDTTAIGDTVNVAARLEALTKERGIGILISDDVRRNVTLDNISFIDEGEEHIRGRSQPIHIFDVRF